MFERFTEKARRVVFFARYEASKYGSPTIDTEHLLLGLLRENKQFAGTLLSAAGADSIRQEIERGYPSPTPTSTTIDLPLSVASKIVLNYAAKGADELGHKHIGTEHLLLGLLQEGTGVAAQILKKHSVQISVLRLELAKRPIEWWPSFENPAGHRPPSRIVMDTIKIHGASWNTEYILDAVTKCRQHSWLWTKSAWVARDIVIQRNSGAISFDLSLAKESSNFSLVRAGWKKDHCAICHWELFESTDSPGHGTGYTNGLSWLCTECYEKFLAKPDFFSSSYDDIT
ncbi:MAG TPA: Clp protease N-terminal domain-containing protein [Terriglobales bacterium]|jgi:hypothetical protein|nr:Clp protease N-terminal domain-containing protein [Terriglobales bacterium]